MGTFENPSLIHQILIKIAYISLLCEFMTFSYTYAKILKKSAFIIVTLNIVIICIIIILPYELAVFDVVLYVLVIDSFYFYHTVFVIMRKSQKNLRAGTLFILFGSSLMGQFQAWMTPSILIIGITPTTFFIVWWIIGIFLCLIPNIIDPESISREIKSWYIYCILLIGLWAFISVAVSLIGKRVDTTIMGFAGLGLTILECSITLNHIKKEDLTKGEEEIALGGVFARPKRITEQEVTLYRDQAVCLVCKGKVAEFSYICRNCKALYCQKCVRAIIEMENACWACDTALDESKPVKIQKKAETQVEIEPELHKKT